MPHSHDQQVAASRRASELHPDGAARMEAAHRVNKLRAAQRRLDKIIGDGVPLTADQLHGLAQRLQAAARAAERAEQAVSA